MSRWCAISRRRRRPSGRRRSRSSTAIGSEADRCWTSVAVPARSLSGSRRNIRARRSSASTSRSSISLARERAVRNLVRACDSRSAMRSRCRLPMSNSILVVCRHLLQAVPDAMQVLKEIRRVLRPGGRAHLIAEDYGMLWCHRTELGSDGFWQVIPWRYEQAVGCDLHVGRKMFAMLHDLQMRDIAVDYVVVDTARVARETFARIWEAWRDGFADSIAQR